jgi:hypothetical protein
METACLATLQTAVAMARSGARQRARDLCAAVVFQVQPLLPVRPALLMATLHALLLARGFRLLTRVVRAISGHVIEVVLLADNSAAVQPPRMLAGLARSTCALDPRWLARLSPDEPELRRWCDWLFLGGPNQPVTAAADRHSAEPAERTPRNPRAVA